VWEEKLGIGATTVVFLRKTVRIRAERTLGVARHQRYGRNRLSTSIDPHLAYKETLLCA